MDLKKMTLRELMEFARKDETKDNPVLDDVESDSYKEWKEEVLDRINGSDTLLGDLIAFGDFIHSGHEDWDIDISAGVYTAISEIVCSDLEERVNALENSIEVLLKQHGKETANISVEQLNRLKGGYQ